MQQIHRRGMITVAKKYYLVALFSLASSPPVINSLFVSSNILNVNSGANQIRFVSPSKTNTRSCLDKRCGFFAYRGGGKTATGCRSAVTSPIETLTLQEQEAAKAMGSMTASAKLGKLRERMKELDLDVYLIPTDDPHLSGK